MFYRFNRLAFSVLLSIGTLMLSAVLLFPIGQPARSLATQLEASAGSVARMQSPGRPLRPLEVQHLSGIEPHPVARPLAAGAPQTITVQVAPDTLIANSGLTATITATVQDMTGDVASGVSLTGTVTPGRGTVDPFGPTDANGQATSTWTATTGTAVGSGAITVAWVDNSMVSGTAAITLTAGTFSQLIIGDVSGTPINTTTLPIYNTLVAYAFGYDAYNNPLGPQSATWGGTGVVTGHLSPTIGISTTFTPAGSGTGTITAASGVFTDTAGPIIVLAPVLLINKTDSPDPVEPGGQLNYTIVYTNSSSFPAQNVMITETYPLSISNPSASPSPSNGNNVWSIGDLPSGATGTINVTVTVDSPMPYGSVLINTVRIGAAKAATAIDTDTTQVKAPNLHLTKSAYPVSPVANGLLTYTLSYTNSGSASASNVVVTDAVPINTASPSCAPAGCILGGNIVTWTVGQVPGQSSGALTLTLRINNNLPDGTILTNIARIASDNGFPALAVLTSTVSSKPNLTLTKSDGVPTAAAGDTLNYLLSYSNNGSAPAQNVVITDHIPANVSVLPGCSCTLVGGGIYSFTLNTVPASQGGVVTLSVRVNPTLPAGVRAITNTAYIRTSTPGDDPSDNIAQDVDSITTVPVMALSAAYDASTPYPGKLITYTLRYTNTSAMDTTGVVISVTRSPYVNVVPTGWSSSGGYDTRTIGNLAAGQAGTISYVVSLSSTFTAAMNVFNNTFLIHDGGPGGLPPATQTVPTAVGVPDLFIESVSVPIAVLPGTKFTATLTIRNGGTGRACNPANPSGCSGFIVDSFVDPATPPPSYPYMSDGQQYSNVPPIPAGLAVTVDITDIVYTDKQQPILYFKVDNYACPGTLCLPVGSRGGLVPESNEYNNVFGPVTVPRYAIDLPIVMKNKH